MLKNPPASAEGAVESGLIPGWRRSRGEGNGNPLLGVLAWAIAWTEEPGGVQSMGPQKNPTQLSDWTKATTTNRQTEGLKNSGWWESEVKVSTGTVYSWGLCPRVVNGCLLPLSSWKAGGLQSLGLKRVGHALVTEQRKLPGIFPLHASVSRNFPSLTILIILNWSSPSWVRFNLITPVKALSQSHFEGLRTSNWPVRIRIGQLEFWGLELQHMNFGGDKIQPVQRHPWRATRVPLSPLPRWWAAMSVRQGNSRQGELSGCAPLPLTFAVKETSCLDKLTENPVNSWISVFPIQLSR